MRSLLSPVVFLLALILGAFAFAYATIEYGDAMRDLTASAHGLPDRLQTLGLGSQYVVWADILLGGDKLIFIGFIILARIFLAIAVGFLGFVLGAHSEQHWRERQPAPARGRGRASAFDHWG
jgi:hypothetical protein